MGGERRRNGFNMTVRRAMASIGAQRIGRAGTRVAGRSSREKKAGLIAHAFVAWLRSPLFDPLRLLGKSQPATRHFLEKDFYGWVRCSRRGPFRLSGFLATHLRPG
jgi:hypothetical protein